MSMQEFRKQVQAPVSVEALFAWHERSGAFERLSPPWDRPKVLEHTGGIRDGAKVVLQLHAGPFTVWEHTHRFAPIDARLSTLDDHIRYELPLGVLGSAVAGAYTQRTLERVFAYRHAVMLGDLARHAQFADRPRLRIAITGASGFIGAQLAAFLSTGGHDVIRIGRRAPKPGSHDVQWNPERGQLDPRALEGVDAVIHLAGASIASRWTSAHRAALKRSRVAGTLLLAHTLAQLTRKPRVLLSGSAIGIYGSRGDELLDERSTLGGDYLAEVGRAWESSTAPAETAGIRVVHLRTGIVQGAAGGALGTQAPLFRYGAGGTLGPGTQWISPVALDDEIGAIHFCMMRDDVRGPVNIVAPTAVTNAAYTKALGSVLCRPTIAHAPAFALRLLLGEEMANLTVLASQRVVPRVLREAGFAWRLPMLEQMLRFELGE